MARYRTIRKQVVRVLELTFWVFMTKPFLALFILFITSVILSLVFSNEIVGVIFIALATLLLFVSTLYYYIARSSINKICKRYPGINSDFAYFIYHLKNDSEINIEKMIKAYQDYNKYNYDDYNTLLNYLNQRKILDTADYFELDKEDVLAFINGKIKNQNDELEVIRYKELQLKQDFEKGMKTKSNKLKSNKENYDIFVAFINKFYLKYKYGIIGYEEYEINLDKFQTFASRKISFPRFRSDEIYDLVNYIGEELLLQDFKTKISYREAMSLREIVASTLESFGDIDETLASLIAQTKDISHDIIEKTIKEEKRYFKETIEQLHFEKDLYTNDYKSPNNLDGIEFEKYLRDLFTRLGYKVIHTPISGDQGADLIVEDSIRKIVIQAKYYSSPVSNKAVQEVFAAKGYYKCDEAMVITNSSYTSSAKQLASVNNVILVSKNELEQIEREGKLAISKLLASKN